MYRLILFGFLIVLLSCKQQPRPKTEQRPVSKFYDFNLKVDIINPFAGVDSEFLYANAGDYFDEVERQVIEAKNFKPNTLYLIPIFENINKVAKKDTFQIKLTNKQIDTLYSLVTALFDVSKRNIAIDSIPPSPSYNDGLSIYVELDLMSRGNKYMTKFNFGSELEQNKGAYLYKYLLKLKNNR